NYQRSFTDSLMRRIIFAIFPYPKRLRWLALPAWLYQASGLRYLVRHSGLLNLLPSSVKSAEALQPEVSLSDLFAKLPTEVPAAGKRRLRVGLLAGCVQSVFFSRV